MRKFLSVLLALLMVVSTVSYAAPSAVTVADSATDAVVYETTDVTTENEMAELAEEVHEDYGQLVYEVDFDQDNFALEAFQKGYAKLSENNIASYMDSAFDFSNVTTYTNTEADGVTNPVLKTENNNKYLSGTVTPNEWGYGAYFRMSKYTMKWPDGQYTFSVDVKISANQATGFASQCNDTKIELEQPEPFDINNGNWQTVINQQKNVVSGDDTVDGGFYGFFVAPHAPSGTEVAYDNWRVYYKADTATVTIDPNGKTGNSEVWVDGLTANSNVNVATLVEKAREMDSSVIGLATEPAGDVITSSTHHVAYYDRLYAVYGFTVTVNPNGNDDFGSDSIVIPGLDTRHGYTIGEVVDLFNENSAGTTTRELRGFATTPDGEPLADNTVINTTQTLYAIWKADESEFGTLLFNIDFENFNVGDTVPDFTVVEINDTDAIANREFTINWEVGNANGNKVAEMNGNKYIRGGQAWAQFRVQNSNYGAVYSPMPEGAYTLIADVIDFGSSTRVLKAIAQGKGPVNAQGQPTNLDAKIVDSWNGKINEWDNVIATWENMDYSDMTWYFTDGATTEVGFDNVKLYYAPAEEAKFYVTVNANGGNSNVNNYVVVDSGDNITASALAGAMSGCLGVAYTADGAIIPSGTILTPKYNTTVYAVWGFDVTLDAGQNAEMSDIVVSDIDVRVGTTIGELLEKINNTTDRELLGLSKSVNGDILSADTKVTSESTYYMIWELDESEFGTLLFQIDFEKEGISLPGEVSTIPVKDIATYYNSDLVFGNRIMFSAGKQSGSNPLDNRELIKENGNTYFEADFSDFKDYDYYTFFSIFEQENKVEWMDGTYTFVADFKTDAPYEGFAYHVNNLGRNEDGTPLNILDDKTLNVNVWDTVAYQYTGAISTEDYGNGRSGSIYFAPRIGNVEGRISVDNIRLYFKTEETVFTVKNGGNPDVESVEIPVSTTDGITVGEMLEKINWENSKFDLLGIANTSTGAVLDLDEKFVPDYQRNFYMIWERGNENPMRDNQLGRLLFAVDFEKEGISGWDGFSDLNKEDSWSEGSLVSDVATLYDKELFDGKNVRIEFLTNDRNEEYFSAGIYADEYGDHYLKGTNGKAGQNEDGYNLNGTKHPQMYIENNDKVVAGNGIYTVFVEVNGSDGDFNVHTSMTTAADRDFKTRKIDFFTYEDSTWEYKSEEWNQFAYRYEVSDGGIIPMSGAYFSLNEFEQEVSFDNYKLYFKPYTATITLLPGDYPEFGVHYAHDISTTGENTAQDILDQLAEHFDAAGKTAVGLLDEYGFEVDLEAGLIIPCDMTYTIIWGEDTHDYVVTEKKNAVRYSSNNERKGIRFLATTTKTYAYDEAVTEYGWIVTRESLLVSAGISPACFTKESKVAKASGQNYGYQNTGDEDADRKHLEENDDNVLITMVVYGLTKPEQLTENLVARPYMVVDGEIYYGQPWARSMFDTALALKNNGYNGCDEDTKAYVDEIINTVLENSKDTEFDYGEL